MPGGEMKRCHVPDRGASVFDLAAEVAGASLAVWWLRKEAVRPTYGMAW